MSILVAASAVVVAGSALGLAACGGGGSTASDERAIRAELSDQFSANVEARDVDAIMSIYDENVVAYDAFPPRQYSGADAYRKAYEGFFAAFPGPVTSEVSDLRVEVAGDLAYAHGVDRWIATDGDGKKTEVVFRFTEVLREVDGKWLIVHEHLSFPADPVTGMADFASKP